MAEPDLILDGEGWFWCDHCQADMHRAGEPCGTCGARQRLEVMPRATAGLFEELRERMAQVRASGGTDG